LGLMQMFFEIKDLKVRYEGAEVVKGVSLYLEQGEIVTLIGSNGAGKTTILRAISGLKAPSDGEIWFDENRVDGRNPQSIVKMGIVQVPQGRGLFPYMSVAENLRVGAFLRKDKKAIAKDLAEILVHFPRLKERARQQASTLSGGEQQMLAIATAIMCKPRLLLLDEPSMGLSPLMVAEIAKIVREINAAGTTVLLVEQNSRLALKLAVRAYVLETGNIVVEGQSQELLHSEHVRKAYLGE
jgi:branched-chain amino acid transport system ATP-binding protein